MIFKDLLESRQETGENMALVVILSGRILSKESDCAAKAQRET